tara:strand:+ start:1349 stop:1696 length:348 start_codon:yes stop_codon:yes gene_type:complete
MKIKLKDIKQIVEGVVKNALSEQEQEDAPDAPEVDATKIKDTTKAVDKMDAQQALITLLQFIDTPVEIENFVKSVIQRLDPKKVTDQEIKVAFTQLYKDAVSKDMDRQGKDAAGE